MNKCRTCGSTDFKKVIDFGKSPLVNSLIEKEDLDKEDKQYPLIVHQCQDCFLVQIINPLDSHKIYQEQDYLYFSSDMPKLDAYFKEFAVDIGNRFINSNEDLVVEIGSNDGIFLEHFGTTVLGVDPATNVVIKALQKRIPTLSDFFTEKIAKNILKYWGKAKVIGGSNCIAHLSDIDDMMKGVKLLLKKDGMFFVECNYWGAMVKNKNYSLIYHDHFSYFTLKNWCDFLEKYDMEVFDAWITPAQGGSLRLYAGFKKYKHEQTQRFREILEDEYKTNLNSYETAIKYATDVLIEAVKLNKLITKIKSEGKIIAGYGAAAKGFSVLKLANITDEHISYFVDDSPAKQGKYTPVTHIQVFSRDEIIPPDYFFITAPNYLEIIIAKEQQFLKDGGKFITVDSRIIK